MSLPIFSRKFLVLLFLTASIPSFAQNIISNPGEYAALASGNLAINDTVKSEIQHQGATGILQNGMSGEFAQMKKWERDYNNYLKTATGYASAIKAATHIYDDGVRILITLNKLRKAVSNNPQGVVATVSMNNLYGETVVEMISVYKLIKTAVAQGGSENMLTGAERSKVLWALEDRLSAFSHKLHLLYISIRHYTLADVWNQATAGIIERNNGDIARQSLDAWRRCANEVSNY